MFHRSCAIIVALAAATSAGCASTSAATTPAHSNALASAPHRLPPLADVHGDDAEDEDDDYVRPAPNQNVQRAVHSLTGDSGVHGLLAPLRLFVSAMVDASILYSAVTGAAAATDGRATKKTAPEARRDP